MDSKITWQDPPPTKGGNTSEQDVAFAEELRAHPGEWAIWRQSTSHSVASQVKRGLRAGFQPAGAFEATARSVGNQNNATIYVRYVGEPS